MVNRGAIAAGLAVLVAVLIALLPGRAGAQSGGAFTYYSGSVIVLRGTPHLWIADEQGVLHWAGDTRALASHTVRWDDRHEVPLEQLLLMRRGDPWLSAGLVKLGDPIYFVKWEADQSAPTLLHIQSIADVELFGIHAGNYGALVLDQSAWERRFGLDTRLLSRGVLASANLQPTATPTRVPPTPTRVPTPVPQPPTPVPCMPIDPETYARYGVATNPPPCFLVYPGAALPSSGTSRTPSDSDLAITRLSVDAMLSRSFPQVEWRACNRTSGWAARNVRATFDFYYDSLLPTLDSGSDTTSEVLPGQCRTRRASLTALGPWVNIVIDRVTWTWERIS
jgi:hypothetical protein